MPFDCTAGGIDYCSDLDSPDNPSSNLEGAFSNMDNSTQLKEEGMKNTHLSPTVLISPNPTDGAINLQVYNFNSSVNIQLFTNTGVMVFEDIYDELLDNQVNLNLKEFGLKNGVYFIRVFDDLGTIQTSKVILTNSHRN